MNGKERILRTFNFKEIDRVPVMGGFVIKESFLKKISGAKDFWENPYFSAVKAYRQLKVDGIMQLVLPSREESWVTDSNKSNSDVKVYYENPKAVLNYIDNLPSLKDMEENFNFEEEYKRYLDSYLYNQKNLGEDIFWLPWGERMHCRFEWYIDFGYENYMVALGLYKNKIQNLFEYSAEEAYLRNKAVVSAIKENKLPPYVYFGADICGSDGPIISTKDLDKIYFPFLEYSLKPLFENDIKIIWHSDGNIMPLLDRLIEVGIDGFQGFQEELGVDLRKIIKLKTKRGDKPLLIGSVSVTTTLPYGSIVDIRNDVKRCIDMMAPGGGFVLSPSSSVMQDVPDRNIIEFYKYGREYGKEFYSS